jgi:hypothetical protein
LANPDASLSQRGRFCGPAWIFRNRAAPKSEGRLLRETNFFEPGPAQKNPREGGARHSIDVNYRAVPIGSPHPAPHRPRWSANPCISPAIHVSPTAWLIAWPSLGLAGFYCFNRVKDVVGYARENPSGNGFRYPAVTPTATEADNPLIGLSEHIVRSYLLQPKRDMMLTEATLPIWRRSWC